VISTPYDLTFDHATCAYRTATALDDCLAQLCITPAGAPVVEGFQQLPLYALGHSNGALLHLLAGRCASHRSCDGWTLRMRTSRRHRHGFSGTHTLVRPQAWSRRATLKCERRSFQRTQSAFETESSRR
jgi:hypothetical protein